MSATSNPAKDRQCALPEPPEDIPVNPEEARILRAGSAPNEFLSRKQENNVIIIEPTSNKIDKIPKISKTVNSNNIH